MRGTPATVRNLTVLAGCCALVASACGGGGDDGDPESAGEGGRDATAEEVSLPDTYAGYHSDVYADDAHWLCKPGLEDDVCARDLDATAVLADGSTEIESHETADDPAIDCFYVYPTVSADQAPNSDFEVAESQEIRATYNQAARLTGACRVFAPVYRQATLSTIGGGQPTEGVDPREVAYGDVVDAFRQFIANESDGRGFVLIGHSQGAAHLAHLVAQEIDDEPRLRDRMVAAYLLGWPVAVPDGEVVGGDFQHVPACEAPDQTGCVVSYSSFRSTAPPPPNALFGRPIGGDGVALCTNPASLQGGSAALHPYFELGDAQGGVIGGASAAQPFADPARTSEITTPFVTYPDFIDGECVQQGGHSYLSLTVHGDPSDPRTDDIGGDLTPEWGMHLIDANVAMGDIVDLVKAQAEAYAG